MQSRTIENGVLKIHTKNGVVLIDAEDEKKLEGHYIDAHPCKKRNNYIQVRAINKITKKFYMLSRMLMNCDNKSLVDHINHNTLDNRKSNLRICSKSENAMNSIKQKRNTSSKYKGVCFCKRDKVWMAYAKLNQKVHNLGLFDTELEAAKVYNKFAIKNFGEYALLNNIQ